MVDSMLTESDFMSLGLDIAGFKNWRRSKKKSNLERFQAWYSANPLICAKIWVDLQTITDEEGRIEGDENPVFLLLALRFLRAYPTEIELSATFQMTQKTVRTHCSVWVRKLQLLKFKKVSLFHISCDVIRLLLSHSWSIA
jgi:hypothetical protein